MKKYEHLVYSAVGLVALLGVVSALFISVLQRKRDIGLLLEGARQHGLPPDYVQFLESFELAVDEREA